MIDPQTYESALKELDDLHFRLGEAEHSLSGMYNRLGASETLLSEANLRIEALSITLDATQELLGQAMSALAAIHKHARWSGVEYNQGNWEYIERIASEALELRQFEG